MNIKENMLKNEIGLSQYATLNKEAKRIKKQDEDIRSEYFRDIDRIIHSLSYTRYIDKTQVFSFNENDHISKRMIHVQLVSKIARTIARALNLNEDLCEAIALGHDIGHVPFGHVGESILNEISLKYDNTYFMHNAQSVRNLMFVENNGDGLNLTIQVLDGILCHNGEFLCDKYYPKQKTKEEFIKDYENCYLLGEKNILIPMTLEGCIVRISDMIGYLGRDIEDAIMLGNLDIKDIPLEIKNTIGTTNREIVNNIIIDIINNSYNKPYIKLSDEVYYAIKKLKEFNYKNIYNKANKKEQIEYYKELFNKIFLYCLENIDDKNNDFNKHFLANMNEDYLKNTSNVRKVIDYISGMTDNYMVKEYKKINKQF